MLLIGLSILLKLEKYSCKVIHLFIDCFVARQQLCTNLLLSPPKKNDIWVSGLIELHLTVHSLMLVLQLRQPYMG